MRCPECKHHNPPEAKKCERCGFDFSVFSARQLYEMSRKRIGEIDRGEAELRRERSFYLRGRPWYKNPTNILALFTILAMVTIFLAQLFLIKDKKELTISYSGLTPFFFIHFIFIIQNKNFL